MGNLGLTGTVTCSSHRIWRHALKKYCSRLEFRYGYESLAPGDARAGPVLGPEGRRWSNLHTTLQGIECDPRDLWPTLAATAEAATVGGIEVRILDPTARAMHVALHAAQHGRREAATMRDLGRALALLPFETWNAQAADLAAQPGCLTCVRHRALAAARGRGCGHATGIGEGHLGDGAVVCRHGAHRRIHPGRATGDARACRPGPAPGTKGLSDPRAHEALLATRQTRIPGLGARVPVAYGQQARETDPRPGRLAPGSTGQPMSRSLRIRPGVVEWRQLEEEIVAVDTRQSTYMAVNRSGALLWPALLEGATREELVECLVGQYGLDRGDADRDVHMFIKALEDQDLLES